jgi:hypothetical protein
MRSLCVAALLLLASAPSAAIAQNVQRLPSPRIALLPPVSRAAPTRATTTASRDTYDTYFAPAPPVPDPPPESVGPQLSQDVAPQAATHVDSTGPAGQQESGTGFSAWAGCEPALERSGWSADDCCGGCDGCDPCCGASCDSGWFAVTGAVVLTRNRGPAQVMTYQTGSSTPLLTTQAANPGWTGGGEVTLGYAFGGYADNVGPWGALGATTGTAIAVTWWGTGEMNGYGRVDDTTGNPATALDASFNINGITLNGNPFSYYFQGASQQRLYRTDIANSAEVNLLGGTLFSSDRLQVIGLAGFRYFRFGEDLAFTSLTFGGDPQDPDDWGNVRFKSLNSLYGAQLGSIFNFRFGPQWSMFFVPKAGVYGNRMSVNSRIYSGSDVAYNFTDHKSDIALLGQIDTGVNCRFRPNAYGYIGYRFLGAANLALGDSQFAPSVGDLKQSGSVILHGAFLGVGWLF